MVLLQFVNILRRDHDSFSTVLSGGQVSSAAQVRKRNKVRWAQILLHCEMHGINKLNGHVMGDRIFYSLQGAERGRTLNSFPVGFCCNFIARFDPVTTRMSRNRKTFV